MSTDTNTVDKPIPASTANEFEFLRSLPFGPYLPVDSPLHRLDPRTRILLVVLFITGLLAARSLPGLALVFVVVMLIYRLGSIPYGPLLRGWRGALPLFLILVVFQILSGLGAHSGRAVLAVGPVVIYESTVRMSILLIFRFAGLIAILSVGAASISESELTRGLESLLSPLRVIGIPVTDFVMIIQVTLRYFPLLAQTAERIAKAQASRGADWQPTGWNIIHRIRQVFPMIVPLFVSSLRRAENMALAMDARGYGSVPIRSSIITLRFGWKDLLGLALAVGVVVLGILL